MENHKIFRPRNIGYALTIITFIFAGITSIWTEIISLELKLLVIICFGIIVVYSTILDKKHNEINYLNRLATDNASTLLSSYNQLKEHESQQVYLDFFKKFSRYKHEVVGIQMYNYHLASNPISKINLKLEYDYGYIEEGNDVNAIIKSEYTFRKLDILKLKRAIFLMRITKTLKPLSDFYINGVKRVEESPSNKNFLALLSIAERELDETLNLELSYIDYYRNRHYLHKKRINLAEAIVKYELLKLTTFHSFSYVGKDSNKNTRHYISYIVETNQGDKKLFLILLNSQLQEKNDIILLNKEILASFKHLLKSNNLVKNSTEIEEGEFHENIRKISRKQ